MPTAGTVTSTFVKASPEDIFAYISDLSRHGEWAAADLKVEAISGGAVAVGSEYRSVASSGGKEFHGDIRVTEYSPPSRFSFVVNDETGRHTHEYSTNGERAGALLEHRVISELSPIGYIKFKLFDWPRRDKQAMETAYKNLRSKLEPEVPGYLRPR